MEQPYRQEAGKSPVPPDRMLVEAGDLAELPFTFARPKSVLPLVAVLGIFCFSILGLFIAGSMELDRFARDQSRTLAQTAVAKSLADVAFVTRDYGFWDAAVENLIRRPDSSWADSNVGTYAWEELGMSRTLVLGSDNTPLYTMKDGETSSQEVLFSVGPPLIRLAERARQTSWLNPEARTSFILLNKRVYLVAASVLTPEEPSPAEIGSFKRGVLIFMRVLDDEHPRLRGGRRVAHNGCELSHHPPHHLQAQLRPLHRALRLALRHAQGARLREGEEGLGGRAGEAPGDQGRVKVTMRREGGGPRRCAEAGRERRACMCMFK